MCENNMKNMHTDVRINDYFSSENIAFALYKKVIVSKLFSW